jgi:hypothetical protein
MLEHSQPAGSYRYSAPKYPMKTVLNIQSSSPFYQCGICGVLVEWVVMRAGNKIGVFICRFTAYFITLSVVVTPLNIYMKEGNVVVFISIVN